MRTFTLLLLVSLTTTACLPTFHKRSPLTDAFSRDPRVALPAIAELGNSDRDEAQAVLMYIARDPDVLRREAALNSLRSRARMVRDELKASGLGIRDELRTLHDAMEEAFRNANVAGVAAFYADEAIMLGRDGKRVAGRDGIDDYWSRMNGAQDWELTLMDVEGKSGLWVERGRSRLSVLRDGETQTSEVDFLLIWQRQADGTLLIVVDAFW